MVAVRRSTPVDPEAVARACQAISAHTTADELLEVAARAALELTGAGACVASARHADGSPWWTVHIERRGGELARIPHAEPASSGPIGATAEDPRHAGTALGVPAAGGPAPVELPIVIDGAPRGMLSIGELVDPDPIAEALAPLTLQIGVGLKHAALYAELEALVVREMLTSVEREQAMQLVLDSMHDGLMVCELDGRASAIRSRSMTTAFGEPAAQQTIWDYLAGDDHDLALGFEIAWEQTVSDVLPFELAASQMPTELHHGGRSYRLSYQRVERDGVLAQIAVSVRDITEELAARRAHELAHELAGVVRSVMADRDGFCAFLDETDRMLHALGEASDDQARWIHTLKGNTAMFGFCWFATRCHELEDELAGGGELDAARLARLRASWRESIDQVRPFVGTLAADDVTVARDELADQIRRMRDAGVARELLAELDRWRNEPVGPSLVRLARQAEQLAERQGKQLEITIEGPRVRFADDRMRRLLPPLVHAVRNAVDHGLESSIDRLAAGKPETGQLVLACRQSATELVIEVRDDGRGVSWDRVRDKADLLGLPSASRADLLKVLFADGVSTTTVVSEISGRGVGLGALRETCEALGGTVRLDSEPGQGTRLTCRIPIVA